MREVETAVEGQDPAGASAAVPADAEAETRTVTEAPAADDENAGLTGRRGKQQPVTAAPMTAHVAQDGKVEFKLSMNELPPEQQAQVRQDVQTQIIEQVRSLVSQERTEFYLQLKPEYLGGLSILLSAGEKGVAAKLTTGSKDVQLMIQSDMSQIQEILRERGINVVQMEVVYDQMASTTGKQDTNDGQGWEQGSSAGGRVTAPEDAEGVAAVYEELSSYDVLAEQGGSVEFSA
jgi:flagellar hook-length control protein FliK